MGTIQASQKQKRAFSPLKEQKNIMEHIDTKNLHQLGFDLKALKWANFQDDQNDMAQFHLFKWMCH